MTSIEVFEISKSRVLTINSNLLGECVTLKHTKTAAAVPLAVSLIREFAAEIHC